MNLNDALLIWAKENIADDVVDAEVVLKIEKDWSMTYGSGELNLIHEVAYRQKMPVGPGQRYANLGSYQIGYFELLNDLLEIAGRKDE
jgi:hypothetical protein